MNVAWLYVAAIYGGAVVLVRRCAGEGAGAPRRRVAFLFYLVVLVALFRPLTTRTINFAADVAEMIPPWSAGSHVTKYNVSNLEIHDATIQLIPWGHQVREAWRHGRIPLWNALAGCGYPLLANGQSSALAPTRLLALPIPDPYWVATEAALKLLIALTFTFLYLRKRGSSEIASIAGAISFALSTYIVGWLHYAHATVAVFTPAVFFAIDLIAERISAKRITFAAIVVALMVFGGHVESVVYIAAIAVVYVLWILFGERIANRWRFLGALVATQIAATLIAAPFLAPFYEAVTRSLRWEEVRKLGFNGVPFSDLPSLVLLLQPRFFGGRPLPWGPMTCETITGFAGLLGIAGAAAFVFHANWRDRRSAFFVAGLLAFGVVANWPLVRDAAHALFPHVALARFRLALCWCGAVLAAMLIDAAQKRLALFAGVFATLAALAWLFLRWPFPDRATELASLAEAVPGVVAVMLLLIPRARPLVPAAILVELLVVNRGWNPIFPAEKFYPRTPLIATLEKLTQDGSRIAGIGEPLYPSTSAMFGFADVRAHDPMENARYDAMLHQAIAYDAADYYAKWKDVDTPLLDDLNARWIITAKGVDSKRHRLVYDGEDGRIFENVDVKPPQRREGNRIITSIAAYPGWRSNIGKVITVDNLWVAVEVPPGTQTVKLTYTPLSFWGGVAASIMTLIVLAAASLRTPRPLPGRSTR